MAKKQNQETLSDERIGGDLISGLQKINGVFIKEEDVRSVVKKLKEEISKMPDIRIMLDEDTESTMLTEFRNKIDKIFGSELI